MKVTGSATVAAPPSQVWDALQDPAVLVRTIPGCSRMETVGADAYAMTISAGVASIKGTYAGEVELAEPDPPHSFVLRARGQGAPGTVDATVRVKLTPDEFEGTRIDYDADAVVGGMIGGVGQRVLSTVAKRTAEEFFTAVEKTLTEPAVAAPVAPGPVGVSAGPTSTRPEPAAAATAERAVGQVYTAPERRPRRPDFSAAIPMTAAFALGASVALAGVALGYVMGRRTRR
jgi:uncharacterized protein